MASYRPEHWCRGPEREGNVSDEYGDEWSQAPASPDESPGSTPGGWTESPATGGDAWYQEADANAPPDGSSDLRVKSDFELQILGARPDEAAAAWPTLTGPDRIGVTAAMAAVFGSAFAQAFVVTPTDLGTDEGDIHNIAPSQVEALGFQYARTEGNFQIYYRPSGRRYELKVFHDADRDEQESDPGVPDEDSGKLAEARSECEHLDAWYSSLRDLSAEARHRLRATDYPVAYCRVQQSMYAFGAAIQAATDRSATWRVGDASRVELEGYRARVNAYFESWQSRALADETWDGLPGPLDSDGNFVDCEQILANAGG
jgi:hypothetical protein